MNAFLFASLLAFPGRADTLRVLVDLGDGGAHLVDAWVAPGAWRGPAPAGGEPVEVLDVAGRVLARGHVPPDEVRSVILPEGGGATAVRVASRTQVVLPWPEGATAVRLGAAVRVPSPRRPTPPLPASAILQSGDPEERLDIVILGDGYTEEELGVFAADAERMLDRVLATEPFSAYTGLFNAWRIDRASAESGADHPEASPPISRDTAFSCGYGCGGIDRLICCDDQAVLAALAEEVPGYDGALVLVNDVTYGGSGGWAYATTYVGEWGDLVAIHEVGHSLVGLWDEYSYGMSWDGYDGPNCGRDPEALPWEHWLDAPGVDAFPVCSYTNYYRPTSADCMMKSRLPLGSSFRLHSLDT